MKHQFQSALIHLSDLEFGANFRAPKSEFIRGGLRCSEILADDLERVLYHDLKFNRKDVGLVITGDVASKGKQSEYEDAEAAIGPLVELLGIPREQLAIIPGNHDVNWDSCEAAFKRVKNEQKLKGSNLSAKKPEDRERVRECSEKLAAFSSFYKEMCGRDYPGPEGVVAFPHFARLGVALVGFDTTWPCTFVNDDNYGTIRTGIFARAKTELDKMLGAQLRLIPTALLHHCPVPVDPPDRSYLRPSEKVMAELWQAGFSVVLCGHEHRAKSYDLQPNGSQVFISGSYGTNVECLTQRYKSSAGHVEPNRYSLLLIAPEGASKLMVRKLTVPGAAEATWEPDEANSQEKVVLRRKRLTHISEDMLCNQLILRVGMPQRLPDGKWVVAACFEGPDDVLLCVNSVTYHLDGQHMMALNRNQFFIADFIIESPANCQLQATITTDGGQFVWSHSVAVPDPG